MLKWLSVLYQLCITQIQIRNYQNLVDTTKTQHASSQK